MAREGSSPRCGDLLSALFAHAFSCGGDAQRRYASCVAQLFPLAPCPDRVRYYAALRVNLPERRNPAASLEAEGNVMSSFTAIVSILAAAAAVTFAITAYVN